MRARKPMSSRIMTYRVILFVLAYGYSGAQTRPSTVTLNQAIEEAVANNPDLAAARYGIKVAETRMITARLRPNPVGSVSADHLDALGTGFNSINNAGPPEYAMRTDFIWERGVKRNARM